MFNDCAPTNPARSPRKLALTRQRIEANRRNARCSTGPRSVAGKARAARNAFKHGFFARLEQWSPDDQAAFNAAVERFRMELKPLDPTADQAIAVLALTYVRLAMVTRYEQVAAYRAHQRRQREMDARIAGADAKEATRLREHVETLARAGLWGPTLPDPREARMILTYEGRLSRRLYKALSDLRKARHDAKVKERSQSVAIVEGTEIAKTNPIAPHGLIEKYRNEPTRGLLRVKEDRRNEPTARASCADQN